jgi:hypothetical protein
MFVVIIILLLWLAAGGLIHIIIRKKKITLSFRQIIIFLGCKIAGGEIYGFIFKRYYNGDDTWGLNHDAALQYKKLLQTPWAFFADIFNANPYSADDTFYFHPYMYLERLEYCIVTKTIALFNIISQGNYYINIVFFNFLGFFGLYFLYKLIAEQLQENSRPLAAAVLFLFPPALFWLSGIRAEGLLILFTGILLYHFDQWVKRRSITSGLLVIGSFGMGYIIRDGFTALLVPALLAWWLTIYLKTNAKKIFLIVYTIAIVIIAGSSFLLPPEFNALSVIADRQHDFFTLKGNTRFNLTPLDNNPASFIKVLPEALLNTFIRPFFWEAKGLLQWFAAIENIAVLLFMAFLIFTYKRNGRQNSTNPVVWALVLAALFNYILIGYTVPFPGAAVRYKIIPELFLISACLMCLPTGFNAVKSYRTTASLQI